MDGVLHGMIWYGIDIGLCIIIWECWDLYIILGIIVIIRWW